MSADRTRPIRTGRFVAGRILVGIGILLVWGTVVAALMALFGGLAWWWILTIPAAGLFMASAGSLLAPADGYAAYVDESNARHRQQRETRKRAVQQGSGQAQPLRTAVYGSFSIRGGHSHDAEELPPVDPAARLVSGLKADLWGPAEEIQVSVLTRHSWIETLEQEGSLRGLYHPSDADTFRVVDEHLILVFSRIGRFSLVAELGRFDEEEVCNWLRRLGIPAE